MGLHRAHEINIKKGSTPLDKGVTKNRSSDEMSGDHVELLKVHGYYDYKESKKVDYL